MHIHFGLLRKNIKPVYIFIFFTSFFLLSCEDDGKKNLLSNSWACPNNSSLQTWKDGYPGEGLKYKAIGCKTIAGDRVGYHIAWKGYGVKEHEGGFSGDEPDGEWSYYHENGSLKSRGFFRKGKREGTWSFWDRNGKFMYDRKYLGDNVVNET